LNPDVDRYYSNSHKIKREADNKGNSQPNIILFLTFSPDISLSAPFPPIRTEEKEYKKQRVIVILGNKNWISCAMGESEEG
jgi:hypothetical protein